MSSHNLVFETDRWNRRGRGLLLLQEHVCVWTIADEKTHCRIPKRTLAVYNGISITVRKFSHRYNVQSDSVNIRNLYLNVNREKKMSFKCFKSIY